MRFHTRRMESERLTQLYCVGKFLAVAATWIWGAPWWGILTAPLTFKWFLPPLAGAPGTESAWMSYWIYGLGVIGLGYAVAVLAKAADAAYRNLTDDNSPQYPTAD